VDFVDDVDLVAVPARRVLDVLPQLPDLVDAAVGRPVDLEDVHGGAVGDLLAGGALVARTARRALPAVEGLGQQPGTGRLADATRAGEEEGVVDPLLLDGVDEGAGDVLLAGHFLEVPGAPLACEDQVGHEPAVARPERRQGEAPPRRAGCWGLRDLPRGA